LLYLKQYILSPNEFPNTLKKIIKKYSLQLRTYIISVDPHSKEDVKKKLYAELMKLGIFMNISDATLSSQHNNPSPQRNNMLILIHLKILLLIFNLL